MASKIKVDQILGSTGDEITVPTGQTLTVTDGIPVASGGTGIASFTAGDILYATGATTLTKLNKGTAEQVLAMNAGATAPDWGSVDTSVLPTITVAKGGTNVTSFAAGDILYATGATTLAKLTKPGSTQVLQMTSDGTPSWVDAGGGGLLQLKQTQITDTGSRSATSWGVWDADMNVVITPTLSTSKILVSFVMPGAIGNGGWVRIVREVSSSDTVIAIGDAIGSTRHRTTSGPSYVSNSNMMTPLNMQWLDAPATTSEITYKLENWSHDQMYWGRNHLLEKSQK